MRNETPTRTILLSAYYDATATTTESDYGNFISLAEDYYFAGPQRSIALARLRREIRNNPYLAGLFNNFPSAIGFSNLRSRSSSKKYNDLKELFWYRWKKRVTRAGDSLRSCEEIILREMFVAGEIFIVLLVTGHIQLVPSEYCGSATTASAEVKTDGTKEINGILYDANDRPIAYRFGKLNPSGTITFDGTTPVPAQFVIHVYNKDRVLMGRGLPWALPCLRPAHDLYEITRSKTKQIKDANTISGTIESEEAEEILKGMSSNPTASINDDTATGETEDAAADKQDKQPVVISLKPGQFIALKKGEKLNMLKTQYQASDYKELVMLMLHAMSTPIGLPVELWFSGLGDVSYSGFKGLGTQWNARRRYILFFLEDRYLDRLHFWRISKAAKEGDLPPNPDKDDDLIDWAWRRTAVLDEEKEARANAQRLESGESSLADIWEANGLYPEEVFAQRRQLWIRGEIACGNLKEGDDHSAVIVPREFMYLGQIAGAARPPVKTPPTEPAPAPKPSTESPATPASDDDDK
ncbi:phage portal protein [Oleiharenicola lentus]|uniref:phage portal protein n=1 Tax=Oleiharenicola lentus TaxID=2508720 RepID=UPI003F669CBF